ncbi:HNH endonuclease signature motif containing protein [Neobacillus drentensis]|uniref:HNH endonuclease n=1 Tax=Neobacillus drentensis TaxID=220684 RepID=UPI003000957C
MTKRYCDEHEVSGTELMAMRMMRKKYYADMARMQRRYKKLLVCTYPAKEMEWIEKNVDECPKDLVDFYMTSLGITNSHMAQFKKILKGELKTFSEGRTITQSVKKEVREKYHNKCACCGSSENLQLHHKEYFSNGGQNTVDNLILLCVSCHAEQHKDEHVYNLIKSKG